MLGPDARDLRGTGCDEAGAPGARRPRRKSGPADAGAPECRDPAVLHHRRAVAGAVEIDRLEVLVLLQSQTVEHIARQDDEAGAPRAKRDRLAWGIADALVRAAGAAHDCPGAARPP